MSDDLQLSFTSGVLDELARSTKRAKFLEAMDQIVPWDRICKLVEPFYPVGGGSGRALTNLFTQKSRLLRLAVT